MGAQYMLKTNIDHLEGLKNSSHQRSEVFYLLGLNQLVFTLTQQHSQGKL